MDLEMEREKKSKGIIKLKLKISKSTICKDQINYTSECKISIFYSLFG